MLRFLKPLQLALWNGVEMGRVCIVHDLWDVRRLVVADSNRPIDGREEGVSLDLVRSVAPDPLCRVAAEPENEVTGRRRHDGVAGNMDVVLPVDDPDLRLCRGWSHEWRLPNKHLVHDDSDRPPVAQLRVPVPPEDLRRNVVRRADQGVSDAAVVVSHATQLERFHRLTQTLVVLRLHTPLPAVVLTLWLVVLRIVRPPESRTQPKVGQLYVPVGPNEDVVRLYVSVNETHPMDRFNSTDQLCDVEEGEMLRECSELDKQAHHVSPRDVLHHEIEVFAVLEREEELHDPFIVGLC